MKKPPANAKPLPSRGPRRKDSAKTARVPVPSRTALDPEFIAAAKASKKKFGPLFRRLAKT
jgi:hypothetical protein